MMSVEEAIRARRSVRGYLPQEVAPAVIHEVLALAQAAPSNCNIQPWLVHVVSGSALRALGQKMISASEAGIAPDPDVKASHKFTGVYRERQWDAAIQLYGAMGIERHDRPRRNAAYLRNLDSFGAPHAVFIFMPAEFGEREAVDLGIYAQTLMLALTARGIGSCAQGALSLYPSIIRAELGVESDYRIPLGISFGYEDPAIDANAARVGRASLSENVRFHSEKE